MIKKKDKVFYARVLNDFATCEQLTVNNIVDNEKYHYFTATMPMRVVNGETIGSGETFLFDLDSIGQYVFLTREECNMYLEELGY